MFEQDDTIISPDLALYEVANNIWKHQFLLKDVKEGSAYISLLSNMVTNGSILLVRPDSQLMKVAHQIAGKHKITVYDSVFLALAFETGSELRSFDAKMMDIYSGNR